MVQRPSQWFMQLSRSPDLKQLRDEGYEVAVTERGHLVVSHVPFVGANQCIAFGQLVSTLNIVGDVTQYAGDHSAFFVGGVPSSRDGTPLMKLINQPDLNQLLEEGLLAAVGLSSKPIDNYQNYHHKMTSYIAMISAHAQSIDPTVTAITHPAVADDDPSGPFEYLDSASSRAGISAISDKLRLGKVAIVGLGGTGSYVLDLVAKTPVGTIHLYDGDDLFTHNAFRSPGAASLEELRAKPKKVEYLAKTYSRMKRGITPHAVFVTEANVDELRDCAFVFLTMEGGHTKRLIVEKLTEFGVPFVDVGIGLNVVGTFLQGAVQTITRTPADTGRTPERQGIAFDAPEGGDVYDLNIQIADLNALNATMAVIRWKKLFGFYGDVVDEHFSVYSIDGNLLINDDSP
jgi:hypothetical protein